MNDQPDPMFTAIADLLERSGHPRQEAEALASEAVRKQREIEPGCHWGHVHAEQLPHFWNQAARHRKRKLVLEITADALSRDEWDGHISVEVKDAQTWAQFEEEQRQARERDVN